jgi:hypothetical protein
VPPSLPSAGHVSNQAHQQRISSRTCGRNTPPFFQVLLADTTTVPLTNNPQVRQHIYKFVYTAKGNAAPDSTPSDGPSTLDTALYRALLQLM